MADNDVTTAEEGGKRERIEKRRGRKGVEGGEEKRREGEGEEKGGRRRREGREKEKRRRNRN